MARFPRSNRTRFQGSTKRAFSWFGGISNTFGANTLAAGASNLFTSIDTRTVAFTAPWIIARVRGLLTVSSDQVAADEFVHGAFGIAVVNGEAFDAGVGSIPTPFSESFDDRWLYHTYWAAPSKAGFSQDWSNTIVDGKAMRKVEFGDVVVFVIENGHPTHGAQFVMNFRIGIKLH